MVEKRHRVARGLLTLRGVKILSKQRVQRGFTLVELMIVVAIIGVLVAIAVPSFMDYVKRSKKSEAVLQLNKIGKAAKRVYSETSSYVASFGDQLPKHTGVGGCCGGPDNRCPPVPASFAADPVWNKLDFQIDEPSLFYYDYSSSASNTFVAMATGDLDCDGTEISFVLAGRGVNGTPAVTLTEPLPNAD